MDEARVSIERIAYLRATIRIVLKICYVTRRRISKKYSENIILIIAYVVCKSDLEVEGLKHHVKKHLPDYMIPNRFEKIDEMPLTPSGKADRKALPESVLSKNFP